DHIGLINVVFITPSDIGLIHDNSDERRRFADICICQFDQQYLHYLSEYGKLIDTRNRQLKQFNVSGVFDPIIMESIDMRLLVAGNYIHEKRKHFLNGLQQYFTAFYKLVSGEKDVVGFEYKSDLNETGFQQILTESIQKDRILERTTKGVHKDDIEFTISGFPLKKYGSQGQSKSFLIALKLAQFAYQRDVSGTNPILLLDDIFEKIDEQRAQNLIDLIAGEGFGQILITDTHRERVEKHLLPLDKPKKFVLLNHVSS
ncbi:MAG: DNA replication and repair protein RecF, partial [Bacteroidia bacterium]|nr:DNA replication and repair protein RecF [Bacteroidia bacterium]